MSMAADSPGEPAPGASASQPDPETGAAMERGTRETDSADAPRPANPADYLDVKADRARATLLIKGAAARDGARLTREAVADKLRASKVTHGVDWAAVDEALARRIYDKTHIIAAAKAPGESVDA